jgi:hypothetical protein
MFILKPPVMKAGIPQGKDDTSLSMPYKNLFVSVFGLFESSGGKSTTRGGGLLTYTSIHSDLYLITERCVPNVDMEYIYISMWN